MNLLLKIRQAVRAEIQGQGWFDTMERDKQDDWVQFAINQMSNATLIEYLEQALDKELS